MPWLHNLSMTKTLRALHQVSRLRYSTLETSSLGELPPLTKAPTSVNAEQRSNAWFRARDKMLTASEIAALFKRTPEICGAYMDEMRLSARERAVLCDNKGAHPYMNDCEVLFKKLVSRDVDFMKSSVGSGRFTANSGWMIQPGEIANSLGSETIVQGIQANDIRKWRRMLSHQIVLSKEEHGILRALTDADFNVSVSGLFIHCSQGELPTRWGTRYEAIARNIYCRLYGCQVEEAPLQIHPTLKWLGASPDGVVLNQDRLVELKCPFRGKLSSGPSQFAYWVQTQIQMEVMGIEECDLFECAFDEGADPAIFIDKSSKPAWSLDGKEKILMAGLGRKFLGHDTWLYAPLNMTDKEDIMQWQWRYRTSKTRPIAWRLHEFRNLRFKRNREWFKTIRPILEENYERLESFQKFFDL